MLLALTLLAQLPLAQVDAGTEPQDAGISAVTSDALQMPTPPPGMKALTEADKEKLTEKATEEADTLITTLPREEAEEDSEAVEQQSLELEEAKALEEAAMDPLAGPSLEVMQSVRRLGFANPLRNRMQDALSEMELREGELELAPVTDIAAFDVSLVASRYDIPVEMQPLVAQYIQFFQGRGRKWFRKWMSRSTRYIPRMHPLLEQHGLPKDTVYLAMIESGFSAHAYSWAHASGPWQFISSTGKQYGLRQDFWIDERRDPIKATVSAARYLKQLYKELGHWYLAWAGYNAGGGRIARLVQRRGTNNFWELSEGKGLAKETRHYVPKLIAAALVAKHPAVFGFAKSEFDFMPELQFDEVKIPAPTDLEVIAKAAGVTVEEVQDLNPELKRWCTPPVPPGKPYILRVPNGRGDAFTKAFAKVPAQERLSFKSHLVKKGDTLSRIAAKYGSASEAIMRLNGLKNPKYLKVNSALMIPIPTSSGAAAKATALQNHAARARRNGYVAVRPEEEIPAGSLAKPSAALAGTIKADVVGGKTRVTYGVASGDSLWTISQRFAVTVDELRGWNRIPKKKNALKVGQLLTIWPGAAALPIKETPPKKK